MFLIEWGGMNMLSLYMVNIFTDAGSSIDPKLAPIIVAVLRVLAGIAVIFVLRYAKRKMVLLICIVLTFLSYLALGTYSLFKEKQDEEYIRSTFGWVPLISLIIIQSCEALGFIAIVHFNLQPESFPTPVRYLGCGMCGLVTALGRFSVTKLFPQLLGLFGFARVWYFFSAVLAAILVYCAFLVPENTGQTLVQTEDKLHRNK